MPRAPRSQWLGLAGELRALRSLGGLSTREVAQRTGLSNARVSRVETGHSLLSMPEVEAWASAVGADPDAMSRLRELAVAAHAPNVAPFRTVAESLQRSVADLEAAARRIVTLQPTIVPGLLQTAGYARAVLELVDVTGQDIAAAVAARMRRQEALYDRRRTFEFLVTESALRWPAGDAELMAAQYDRIVQLSTLDNVRIGILPLGRPVSALPWCDVNIYDQFEDGSCAIVDIELAHAEVWVSDPQDVTLYQDLVRRLWGDAVLGADVSAFLADLAKMWSR